MSNTNTINHAQSEQSVLRTNKLIRNTYMLLAMTLAFSAVTAGISMAINPPFIVYLGSVIVSFIMLFILNKYQNSTAALPLVFLFAGLMGFGLGPILNNYLAMANGGQIVMTALGMTALTFVGLSGYVLTTRKDFSFMGGFLMVGMFVIIGASLLNIFLGIPALSLTVSAGVIMIMSCFILYETSSIIHGGETNYIMATVNLYVSLYNMFLSVLSLLGMSRD